MLIIFIRFIVYLWYKNKWNFNIVHLILAIAKSKVDYVQVDALVLLKILKQCQETGGGAESTQGIMTGMVQTQDGPNGPKRIEITNCFGLPNINNIKGANTDFGEGKYYMIM